MLVFPASGNKSSSIAAKPQFYEDLKTMTTTTTGSTNGDCDEDEFQISNWDLIYEEEEEGDQEVPSPHRGANCDNKHIPYNMHKIKQTASLPPRKQTKNPMTGKSSFDSQQFSSIYSNTGTDRTRINSAAYHSLELNPDYQPRPNLYVSHGHETDNYAERNQKRGFYSNRAVPNVDPSVNFYATHYNTVHKANKSNINAHHVQNQSHLYPGARVVYINPHVQNVFHQSHPNLVVSRKPKNSVHNILQHFTQVSRTNNLSIDPTHPMTPNPTYSNALLSPHYTTHPSTQNPITSEPMRHFKRKMNPKYSSLPAASGNCGNSRNLKKFNASSEPQKMLTKEQLDQDLDNFLKQA